jgi:hypothetical protein
MQRFNGQALNLQDVRVVDGSDPLGYADINAPGATTTVTVRDVSGGALSTVYSDDGVTSQTNPWTTDSEGAFHFYAANGRYKIIIDEGLGTEKVIGDTNLFDESDSNISTNTANISTNTSAISVLQADNPNNQTGTAYTLALTDKNKTVWMNNAAANTLTIPTNASVAFSVNDIIMVMMEGAGVTSITGDTGVTVNGVSAGSGDISAQYSGVTLVKRATNTWVATGNIGTVA